MLNTARKLGLIQFSIHDVDKKIIEQEIKISQKYNLKTVKIISTRFNRNPDSVKAQVGQIAAKYLKKRLPHVKRIGIGWGKSIANLVNSIDYLGVAERKHIIPIVGGLSFDSNPIQANYLASILSIKTNSQCSFFYAPVIADSIEEANILRQSTIVKKSLQNAKNVDIAFVGVGSPIKESVWNTDGYINPAEIKELQTAGAVGDVVANFFDKNCNNVQTTFSKRLIGISIQDLKKIKETVLMASESNKSNNVKILLDNNVINSLFISEDIADKILKNK